VVATAKRWDSDGATNVSSNSEDGASHGDQGTFSAAAAAGIETQFLRVQRPSKNIVI
jgi:hypothetical protein